ncbi:CRISPR-associated helicase Cas3' [Anaerostipes sp.]|uniref:CRISPR-associated helicase Cas3' n=1 Tax=Anaerostipes sp. TaxID=1872530 RepID=UPI0025C47EDB|nr:CRISPR-associated helicase Cas3' [Anaerostipes sp.]MBS7006814.1 CRISPR-associated helicase Cas3' [Anaerostipes sp.]
MEYYSHRNPDKLLINHLQETWDKAKIFSRNKFGEVCKIVSVCHDFGKYTSFFQSYLREGTSGSTLTWHSHISALLGAYIVIQNPDTLRTGEDDSLPLFVYHAILSHHGSLSSLSEKIKKPKEKGGFADLEIQRRDMIEHLEEIKIDYEIFGLGDSVEEFLISANLDEIIEELDDESFELDDNPDYRKYFQFLELYSALIAADKFSASRTENIPIRIAPYETLNTARLKMIENGGKKNFQLNSIRTEIFNIVQKQLKIYAKDYSAFSITAPTGTGKTFCGFFAAEKLRALLGDNRTIIYSLPFRSIIEQNYQVIHDLLKKSVKDFETCESAYLIQHHSLAEVEYTEKTYNVNTMQAEMLLENWSSGIVVTTFVQLMETLISNRNRMLKKFHSIAHSILLIDEVQAFPPKLMETIDFVLQKASEELGCKIIMMTATKPILLQDSKELLGDAQRYFRMFQRTGVRFHPEKITLEEFSEGFIQGIEEESYLIICNTIQESLDLYKLLEDLDREVIYLSANLLPIHRTQRIKMISEKLKNGEYLIVISTQVVEAGVDFDFDHVIRDMAPFEAIVQAAGRENRNGLKGRKITDVINLLNHTGTLYCSMVYEHTYLEITQELLKPYKEKLLLEEDYLEVINQYFEKLQKNINKDKAKKFIESIKKLNFDQSDFSVQKFRLIDNERDYLEVFLQIDETAESLYEQFCTMLHTQDMRERHQMQLKLKKAMSEYTLSIPAKYASKINHLKQEVLWTLPKEGCDMFYSEDTGFIRENSEEFLIL